MNACPRSLLSCLSAHAALAVFDGIERTESPPSAPASSLNTSTRPPARPGLESADRPAPLPLEYGGRASGARRGLSRWRCGSEAVGWSVDHQDVRRHRGGPRPGSSRIRSVQPAAGVPTATPGRYVARRARRGALPPASTVWPPRTGSALQRLQERLAEATDPVLVESFPFDEAGARAPGRGAAWPPGLYGNWLAGLPKRSD